MRPCPACPDVLIADWMLKDHIHGLHVADAFKAVNPDLHTILITGFPSRDLLAESDRFGVLQLLEKPFDLTDLREAVDRALHNGPATSHRGRPIAVIALDDKGFIRFASPRARELFELTSGGSAARHLSDVFDGDVLLDAGGMDSDWRALEPRGLPDVKWLFRARQRENDNGWLAVICPEHEQSRTTDPRVRILLDHRSRSSPILPDHGPVVVIERDGTVRRLLVSQVERIGAPLLSDDDLAVALKLLGAEPRAGTVLIDLRSRRRCHDGVGGRSEEGSSRSDGDRHGRSGQRGGSARAGCCQGASQAVAHHGSARRDVVFRLRDEPL